MQNLKTLGLLATCTGLLFGCGTEELELGPNQSAGEIPDSPLLDPLAGDDLDQGQSLTREPEPVAGEQTIAAASDWWTCFESLGAAVGTATGAVALCYTPGLNAIVCEGAGLVAFEQGVIAVADCIVPLGGRRLTPNSKADLMSKGATFAAHVRNAAEKIGKSPTYDERKRLKAVTNELVSHVQEIKRLHGPNVDDHINKHIARGRALVEKSK